MMYCDFVLDQVLSALNKVIYNKPISRADDLQVKSNSSVLYFFLDLMKHLQVIFVPSCYLDNKTSNFVVFNYSV